jgi:1-acyl-sn-glycerol-3-phosphate acyltransferase
MDYEQALDKVRNKHRKFWRFLRNSTTAEVEIGPCDIYEFKRARNVSWLIEFGRIIYLYVLKLKYPHFTVNAVSGTAQVKGLKTNRVILCPNHPSVMDTDMAFLLAKLLQEELYFLTARELFMGSFINEYFLQWFGCYSVLRGTNDFDSFKYSIRILLGGRHKVVIFPEGEVSGRNDLLLPIKPGPAHIACMALDRLQAINNEANVYIVPVALRYSYPGATASDRRAVMLSIENSLNITGAELPISKRLLQAWEQVLKELLAKHGCRQENTDSFYERISAARATILRAIAAYVGYEPEAGLEETELIHRLFLHLYETRWYEEQLEERLDFDRHHERYRLLTELLRDLHRVSCCIAIAEPSCTTHANDANDEINALLLLSDEVTGSKKCPFPVHLDIAFCDPIDVGTLYDGKSKQKLKSIMDVTDKIHIELKAQLERLIDKEKCSSVVESL